MRELVCLSEGERELYTVPYDIGPDGMYLKKDSAFLVFTDRRLISINDAGMQKEYPLDSGTIITGQIFADCGLLSIKQDGPPAIVVRTSMKYAAQMAKAAQSTMAVLKGGEFNPRDVERTCKHCGKPVYGKKCTRCSGKKRALHNFWDLCRSHILKMMGLSIIMLAASGLISLLPYITRRFIDDILIPQNGAISDVLYYIGIMGGILAVYSVLTMFKDYMGVRFGSDISVSLRQRLYVKVQQLSLKYVTGRKPGDLMNRLVSDTGEIRRFLEEGFSHMFYMIIMMTVVLISMFMINWLLTLLSMIVVPLILIISRFWSRKINRMWRGQWRKNDKVSSNLQDVLTGMRVVKSFGKEERETVRFQKANAEFTNVMKYNERFWALFYPLLTLLMGCGVYIVVYIGGRDVLSGNMTPGELAQFLALGGLLYGPLGWMSSLPRMVMRMVSALDRIYEILGEQPDVADNEAAAGIRIKGDIEFDNVTFGYKSYEPVLSNVSLKIKQGEMIGLVGMSGAGKSTMINLVMRLYDANSGEIRIDGTPIKDVTISSLHGQIGVVLQETFLFSGTILENIRFSKPDATLDEVINAAKAANAHDFIVSFPDGYNTYVGERGQTLSGGERQRIAIARAIIGNPRILLLDEATSSLDTESEYIIQTAMERLTKGRTTIAIAHRLSTLKNADRLVVIDKHGIAEQGSHDELVQAGGIYFGLVSAQLKMNETKQPEDM